jgi:hypothetical protein
VLALLVTLLGFALRVEHALTFDGPARGADYAAHLEGVRWMLEHKRSFNFDPSAHYQVRSYPPLWYAVSAVILKLTNSERAISTLAVGGWVVRQALLARILQQWVPRAKWATFAALAIHAVLPLSVLTDGKVNPEGFHSTLFMVAVYLLWRMEREAIHGELRVRTAALFGLFAGLALLTKPTSSVLIMSAALVFLLRVWRSVRLSGWRETGRKVVCPAMIGGVVWCVVTGWWVGPNLVKYGHPFPHVWARDDPHDHPELAAPVPYRRPLGWALPFEWQEYLRFPLIVSANEPRPNFWATEITGTWSDFYNRGFCRLKGGETTDRVWGGMQGQMPQNESWAVTYRCVRIYTKLVYVGLWLSLAAFLGVIYTAWIHFRTGFCAGSLVLPTVTLLGIFFVMMFALVYPYDWAAALNPRYLLPEATPISACFGFGLARLEEIATKPGLSGKAAYLLVAVTILAIGLVAALLLFERFGT